MNDHVRGVAPAIGSGLVGGKDELRDSRTRQRRTLLFTRRLWAELAITAADHGDKELLDHYQQIQALTESMLQRRFGTELVERLAPHWRAHRLWAMQHHTDLMCRHCNAGRNGTGREIECATPLRIGPTPAQSRPGDQP